MSGNAPSLQSEREKCKETAIMTELTVLLEVIEIIMRRRKAYEANDQHEKASSFRLLEQDLRNLYEHKLELSKNENK